MEIIIKDLCKSYGKKEALKGVNLKFEKGMYGLLGPNGAGKTTLMRILTTLIDSSSGEIKLGEVDIKERKKVRSMVGYLPQDFNIYGNMSVNDAMDYLGVLCGLKNKRERKEKIKTLLEKVNLIQHKRVKVRALSGGMRRRLGIAQALLNNPSVLIVDEPTAGLDPEERIRFRNLLRDFSEDRIVILSTHIVEDVEFSCENLAVLKEGQLVFFGKSREFIKKAEGEIWRFKIERSELQNIRNRYNVISTVSQEDQYCVRVISTEKPTEDAEICSPNIEDAYMKTVKGGA